MISGGEEKKVWAYQTLKLAWDTCNVYGPSDGTAVCVGTREVSEYRCLSRSGQTAEEAKENLRKTIEGSCRGYIERSRPLVHLRCDAQGKPTTKAKLGFWERLRLDLLVNFSCPD